MARPISLSIIVETQVGETAGLEMGDCDGGGSFGVD